MPVEKSDSSAVVIFAIDEALWGLDKEAHTVRVRGSEYTYWNKEKLLVAGRRDENGDVIIAACDGIVLDSNHPWVREFRQSLAKRESAVLRVRVVSEPNYAEIGFAEVRVDGNGKRFRGRTGRDGRLRIEALPPGSYTISAAKPNYSLEGGPVSISVLPGACGEIMVRLQAAGRLRGRILDHLGRPVANTPGFDLVGWDFGQNRRDYRISHTFKTNENGEFVIVGVMAGTYYLGANIWGQNHPKRCPLPQVLYPGTTEFKHATPIVIRESDDNSDLTFRLPDFGIKRQLNIRVVGEHGEPVPNTLIENGPAAWDDRTMAAIEEKRTGPDGIAVFEIWATAEYRINARWLGERTFRQSDVVSIPPGQEPVKLTIKLPKSW
jgi:hypothetical protein